MNGIKVFSILVTLMTMTDKNTDLISEIAQRLGKRGGETTAQKYGKDYFRELQKKSTEAKKLKKIAQD